MSKINWDNNNGRLSAKKIVFVVNLHSKIDWKNGKDLKLPLAKNWEEGRENNPRWPPIFFSFFSQLTFCFCYNWPFQIPVAQPQTKSSLHTFYSSATERIPLSLIISLKCYLLTQWFSTTKILDVLLWMKWRGVVLVTRVRNEFSRILGIPHWLERWYFWNSNISSTN